MFTDYEVITSTHISDLQDRVRERIKAGWQPIGGIAVVHEDDAASNKPHVFFAQSVVAVEAAAASKKRKAGSGAAYGE